LKLQYPSVSKKQLENMEKMRELFKKT
jgi:hypothetical protein